MTRARSIALSYLAAASVVSGAAAAPASAAGIRECGDRPSSYAYNVTTRVVSCAEARRVVRAWNGRGSGRVRGLYCRYTDIGYEAGDIRCTGSRGRVVHWQTGV